MNAIDVAQHRLRDALHVAVVNATRRMRDRGLAEKVLAAEGAHIVAEVEDQAELLRAQIRMITSRPWHNEFGIWFSAETGHVIAPPAASA